jgi:hypothetical protein
VKNFSPRELTAISTTVRLPIETLQRVDCYCETKQISRSALFRRLIASYPPIKNQAAKQQAVPAKVTPSL